MKTSIIGVIVVVVVAAVVAGVFLLGGSPIPQGPPGTELPHSGNEVFVTLVADELSTGKYAFNGTADGEMVIVIPEGMDLTINLVNEGNLVHDAHVYTSFLTVPLPVTLRVDDTVGGVSSTNPGETRTGTARTSDLAAGEYTLPCIQTGHATNGMWAILEISTTTDVPYVEAQSAEG